jgi:ADP-ribose pyrophosphatase YjhB (NUDIX family)
MVALQASPFTSLATASWRRGIDLGIRSYISSETPPGELVSSVRAVVLREDSVLTMTNLYGDHILPGGRVEEGETHSEALRRELFEEARVELAIMGRIGFMHLRHTSPKPEDYRYLYPVFIWQIWAASLVEFRPDLMVDDGCEVSFRLLSFQEIGELNLDSHRAAFLEEALAMRT